MLPSLGEAIIQSIGKVGRDMENIQPAIDLNGWLACWEEVSSNVEEFSLTLRLLRTGVDYLKTGGKDRGVLLTLTKAERRILEQAFGLEEEEQE